MHGRESEPVGLLGHDRVDIGIVQLDNRAAAPADQELAGMGSRRVGAADVGVERVEPVNETGLDQEIERPVDGRWRGRLTLPTQLVENVVGTDRLVTVPDEGQHPAPQFREAQAAFAAEPLRRRDGGGYAAVVVVGDLR